MRLTTACCCPPEATQLAIYISWLLHGVKGGAIAGTLFFLPGFLLLALGAALYLAWGDVPLVQGIFYGIRPAVVVLFAAWRIGHRALKNEVLWGMAALAFIGIFVFDIGFPWIVLAAAILGALGGKFAPHKFKAGGGHRQYGPALIDDDTPPPAHARFSWSRLAATSGAFVLIWLGAILVLHGAPDLYRMGDFFTRAAFLTIAAPTPCCPTSTRARWNISAGSPARG